MFWGDEDVEFMEATYEPGGASGPADALVRHSGHEFGHVLSGDAARRRRLRRVRPRARRLDHLPVVDAPPAEQRGHRDGASHLGRPRPARSESARRGVLGGLELRRRTAHPMSGRALVVGVTGISGGNLAQRLLADGWDVAGLCRRPDGLDERITPLTADLLDADSVAAAVRGTAPTHVFFTTWQRRATEAENIDVNGAHAAEPARRDRRREVRRATSRSSRG